MAKLIYTFIRDTVFKMLFMKHQDFLKQLVAELLAIPLASIKNFTASIREVPPQIIGSKHCRLDISMAVNGRLVNLYRRVGVQTLRIALGVEWSRATMTFSSAMRETAAWKSVSLCPVMS